MQTDWKSADGVEHLLGPPGSVWSEIKVLIRPELDDEPLRRTLPASLSETCDRDAA